MSRVDFPLYLVTDRHQTRGRPLVPLIEQVLSAGLHAVQLRERDLDTRALLRLAEEVGRMTRARRALLFVNDRVDVAVAVGADGVHLRSDSLPISVARRLLGAGPLLGVSVHAADEVVRAEAEGADFVVLGPIYDTPSKRVYGPPIGLGPIEEARRRSKIPIFAIGGMTPERVVEVRKAGAFGVAVVSFILSADNVGTATRELLTALSTSSCP